VHALFVLLTLPLQKTFRYWLIIAVFGSAWCAIHMLQVESVPLSEPLARFPEVLGGWQGQDLPLEPRIVKGLRVDDHLNRMYENASGQQLGIYVGYYRSQRTGVTIHSPRNCLPGVGWEPVKAGYAELSQPDGRRVLVNMYEIQKGMERQVVLYWYESHGRVVASEYRAKILMVWDAIWLNRSDAALIRLATPIKTDPAGARQRVVSFAQAALVELERLIP